MNNLNWNIFSMYKKQPSRLARNNPCWALSTMKNYNKILFFIIIFCAIFIISPAKAANRTIEITALINGEHVAAAITINKANDRTHAYFSMYQPGGPVVTTPMQVSLPPGKYFLHVKPLSIHSPIKEQVIPFIMPSDKNIEKKINFPVGYIKITTTEQDTREPIRTKVSIQQGWRKVAPPYGKNLYAPVTIFLSPGQYQVMATKAGDHQKIKKTVTVISSKTTKLNLKFKSSHFGYLRIDVDINGKKLSQQQYAPYGRIILLHTKTHKKVQPISGGYGQPYQLPSGHYDIRFQTTIVGEKDILIKDVVLEDNERIRQSIQLKQPGEIKINALWTDKPKDLIQCIKDKNPFNLKKIGTLLGGPGGTSAHKCFDNRIYNNLITELISVNTTEKNIVRNNNIFVKPGLYKIKVWPFDHKELAKTITPVKSEPGNNQQVTLKFPWPFVKKKVKVNNIYVTRLERKTPLGKGEIHVSATVNGQPITSRALFSVFKLNHRGQETNNLFSYYTPADGNPTGLKLPLQKTIPTGFYHAYVEPFGSNLVLQRKRINFYMSAGNKINKIVNFNTGRLKINTPDNTQINKLRLAIIRSDNTSILHRYHNGKLPFDAQMTPGDYKLNLYTRNNSLYFSKKIMVKEGKTLEILVP